MVQQKLLKVLFDLLLNCKNPLCAQTISSVFKGVSNKLQNTEIFSNLLQWFYVATFSNTRHLYRS